MQNKAEGFMCVSCAWAKPAKPHPGEFCENGAKATAWEITAKRADPSFFAAHTLTELETWRDHDLEAAGRLTHPHALGPGQRQIRAGVLGERLRGDRPRAERHRLREQAVFYTSGRA